MIYFVALVLSVIFSVQTFASEIVAGNTTHVRNGRKPNAGVAIFPNVPFHQLTDLGVAWVLEHFVPSAAMVVLLATHAVLFAVWAFSFRRARAEYARALAESQRKDATSLSPP